MVSQKPVVKAQVGALAVRGNVGTHEVLMITSRDSGRWIIPKGWPMKGKEDHDAAAQEAYEEAGVSGKIHKQPMGAYVYEKRTPTWSGPVRVIVYLLEVKDVSQCWPESNQRKREWLDPHDAASLVEEPGLSDLIRRLNEWPDARIAKNR